MSRKRIIEKIHEEMSDKKFSIKKISEIINENTPLGEEKFKTKEHNDRNVIDVTQFKENDQIILRYYQLLLNEIFQIKQPNRNFIVKQLINILPYLKIYNYLSIFKFDFKNFFNNIELEKVMDQIKDSPELYAKELSFLKETFSPMGSLKPGLGIVNSFSEIVGEKFDKKIEGAFNGKLVIYERYVDDCILIFDSPIEEEMIRKKILLIAEETFGSRMNFNSKKTNFIDFNEITTPTYQELNFDFLGYEFMYEVNDTKMKFRYGIAEEKIEKQKQKLTNIIKSFKESLNVNLFLIRIDMYYKRLVYFGKDAKNSNPTWQVRGISDSYKEATQLFNYKDGKYITYVLDDDTRRLLTGEVVLIIFKEVFEDTSIFNKRERRNIRKAESILNNYYKNEKFISNLFKNKSVLLNPQIGYTKEHLVKVIKESNTVKSNNLLDYEYHDLIEVFLEHIYYVKK